MSQRRWKIFEEGSASDGVETDRRLQQGLLSLLYIDRRREALESGMGIFELERMLGCPEKHLEFQIWYLKEKGWIQRTDTGGFAITANGVDAVNENDLLLRKDRLLPAGDESDIYREKDEKLKKEAAVALISDKGKISIPESI